jgi:hypothetical protein
MMTEMTEQRGGLMSPRSKPMSQKQTERTEDSATTSRKKAKGIGGRTV